jgi:predicted dehydrogenase
MLRVGVVGFGMRNRSLVADLYKYDLNAAVTAVVDPDKEGAAQRMKEAGVDVSKVTFYSEIAQMMDSASLDGVMIGTRCSLHAQIACEIFKCRIPLFIEKPVATTLEDLAALRKASDDYGPKVIVSFPLRMSPIVDMVKDIVDSDQIGTIENVHAVNCVPYGGVYYHNWYRDEAETGGLFLQKATHDFDYINYLLGYEPSLICAMEAKQIFKGDRDDVYCKDCKDFFSCEESPFVMRHFKDDDSNGDMCCFAKDTGNHDSASVIIKYDTGMIASYSQNFFARKTAAKRGARLLGYKGTLDFDWVTDQITVHRHDISRVDTYKLDTVSKMHGGGDAALMYNFIQVMEGKAESKAPLEAGMKSVFMCLKARESAKSNQFMPVKW